MSTRTETRGFSRWEVAMRHRRNISFTSVAFRVGAVTLADLRQAYTVSRERGDSLEAVLTSDAGLEPELVDFIHEAMLRAEVTCDTCGGRTDLPRGYRADFPCRCYPGISAA